MSDPTHKVLLLFGPIAVGKMTVGQALREITGFKLLHAHMVIDLITEFLPFGSDAFARLTRTIVDGIMEEMAKAHDNLILTYIWNFDDPDDSSLIDEFQSQIHSRGGEMYFAELQASLETRLGRNRTENRLRNKKVEWATSEYLQDWEEQHQTRSLGRFPYPQRHILLETDHLNPREAAEQIKARFKL